MLYFYFSGLISGEHMPYNLESLPLAASCGVLVCGGGTAGVVAAIAAARAGADVLVVEQLGQLGGTQSAGWVTPMMPNKILTENLTHGINDDILQRAAQYDPPPTNKSGDLLWFNPVTLALVLDDLLAESRARVLYHTYISDSIVEDGRLTGIVVENKSGRQIITSQITIDCTGDADVAFRAGVPCVSGDPEDGHNQPMSLRFALAGVDQERAAAFLADELGMTCYARPPLFEIGAGEAKKHAAGAADLRRDCGRGSRRRRPRLFAVFFHAGQARRAGVQLPAHCRAVGNRCVGFVQSPNDRPSKDTAN